MSELLADEDFKTGNGIPFIALEGEGKDATFRLCDEAKEFLLTLKAPVALASIVGKYRTGKSLLVNRMLLDIKGGGFPVGATVNSCTKGLWIWNKPLLCKHHDGSVVQLLIIDTEGLGSLDADADHDAKIFALALLLSSFFIYNSVGSIDESALNSLSLVVELTKHIKTKSEKEAGGEPETGENFAAFFPSFLWVVRDFTLQLVDDHNAPITPKAYLERALRPLHGFSEGTEVKNRIRRMLTAFFPERDCVTLKRPVEDEAMMQQLDTAEWHTFRPEFVQEVQSLRHRIYIGAPPKSLKGQVLDGFMLAHLAHGYAETINKGSALNIGDAWSQVSASKNAKALEEAVEHLLRAAREVEDRLPLAHDALHEVHARNAREAFSVLKRESMGSMEEVAGFMEVLSAKAAERLAQLKESNERTARAAAEEEIASLYAALGARVEANALATFGEYEDERARVREAYLDSVPEVPGRMAVLLAFMEAQVPRAAARIEAQVAALVAEQMAEMAEEVRRSAHELEMERRRGAQVLEEAETKLSQARQRLAEREEEGVALRAEMEEMRAAHARVLQEETDALRGELKDLREELGRRVEQVTASAKAELEAAEEDQRTTAMRLALLQQQGAFEQEDKERRAREHVAVAERLAAATDELKMLRGRACELELEVTAVRAQAGSQQDLSNASLARVQALEKELDEARTEVSTLRTAFRLQQAQQAETQQSQRAIGNSSGRSCVTSEPEYPARPHVGQEGHGGAHANGEWGHSGDREEGERSRVAWAANCTDAMGMGGDVVQGLRSELLEARSMLVEMQRKSLGYLDELQELRKKSQEQQRLLSEQQAQLEAVFNVNLYCLQRAAAVDSLQSALSERCHEIQKLRKERDVAVRDADELARELEEQEKHRDSAADNGRGEVKKGGQGLEGGSGGECVHASALHQPTAKTLMNGSHKPRRV